MSVPAAAVPAQEIDSNESPAKVESSATPSRQGSVAKKATPEAAGSLEEIKNQARKSAASALVKLFVDQISEARKRGSSALADGQSADEVARRLGVLIESAMYQNICGGSGEPTESYKTQLRTILFNVKKNPSLRDRLLVGSLTPDALSRMSSQDMASEELQQKDAEIRRESERQHIIVQDQGPRIRRTHKGEELIENESHTAATESIFSAAPKRRNVDMDGNILAHSPMTPKISQRFESVEREEEKSSLKPADKKATANAIAHSQHFESRPRSPGGGHQDREFPEVAAHLHEHLLHGKVQEDADIDKLLRDEEPESPPYSPKEHQDEDLVWHGRVVMNMIAEFSSTAKYVGGADLSGRMSWNELIPSTLLVDGRIDIQLASSYLCGLRFSSSTDVTVVAVSRPNLPSERAGFDKLFDYFAERKRYGVVGKHPLPAVKDTYLVPVEAGTVAKPEFIELLENNRLESPTQERTLLVVFAVKTGESSNRPSVQPLSHQPSQESAVSLSPSIGSASAGTPQAPQQFVTPGARPLPPPQSGSNPSFAPVPSYGGSTQLQSPMSQQGSQFLQYHVPVTGMTAALQVLGHHANSPAVKQLLHQVPNADATQLEVVNDILKRHPETAANFEMLMQVLKETSLAATNK